MTLRVISHNLSRHLPQHFKFMLLRGLFRLVAYPAISYFFIIYYHAKSNDPDGFTALKKAFYLSDTSLNYHSQVIEPIQVVQDPPIKDEAVIKDQIIDLEYPQMAPKSKLIKPQVNDLCQDLHDQQQILYDLATNCQLLRFHQPQRKDRLIRCYTDFPYYERPLNQTLLQNAQVYTAKIESALLKIKSSTEILESALNLAPLHDDIVLFVKECGPTCIHLAKLLYNQPTLPETTKTAIREDYKAYFEAIYKSLNSSITQSQKNILTSPSQPATKTIHPNSSSPDFNAYNIHKSAINLLNYHYEFLKGQKIITPDRIDLKSLQSFSEHAKNIK